MSEVSVREQRVSNLVGDRLCTRCGYNLTGQPVLREPHYNMLIVRCPECATVASVQEYPLLGQWAHRWAMALAGFWLLVLVVMLIGSGAAIFGLSVATAEIATEKYATFLRQLYESQPAPQTAAPTWYGSEVAEWWKKQDGDAVFAQAGGWSGAVEWRALWMWVVVAIVCMALGAFWAVALLGRKRLGLGLWPIAIMIVACGFSAILYVQWLASQEYYWAWPIAEAKICPVVHAMTLGFAWVALTAGMMFGRPIARAIIRMLLPPRSRSALAGLWTVDGLRPPVV